MLLLSKCRIDFLRFKYLVQILLENIDFHITVATYFARDIWQPQVWPRESPIDYWKFYLAYYRTKKVIS